MYVTVANKTTTDVEILQEKSLSGVEVQNNRSKRAVTGATVMECYAQCDAFNCVGFVAVGETDIYVDCFFYSEIFYIVNQENAVAYIHYSRSGTFMSYY